MHRECGGMNGFTVPTGTLVSHPRKRHFTSSTQGKLKWDQLLCGHEIEFTHTADETNQEEERFKIKQEEDQRKEINHKVTHWLDDRHQAYRQTCRWEGEEVGRVQSEGQTETVCIFTCTCDLPESFHIHPLDTELNRLTCSSCYNLRAILLLILWYHRLTAYSAGQVENDLIRKECRRKCQAN